MQGVPCALHYLRTKDQEEVDFALVKDNQIEQIIEVKKTNRKLHTTLRKFHMKYHLPAIQLVNQLKRERKEQGISILQVDHYLRELFL